MSSRTTASRRIPLWTLLPIVLVAVNLRPAITAVGTLLSDIRADLGLGATAAGVLTTLPVICFGLFGFVAPAVRRRFGDEPPLVAGMVLLALGLLLCTGPTPAALFTGVIVAGLAISVGNVAMPAVIKHRFPGHVTLITAVYSTALTIGAAAASGIAVPLSDATGGWRPALGLLAVPAVLAALAWLPGVRRRPVRTPGGAVTGSLWRSALAWQVTGFVGLQSLLAYVVFGWLPTLAQSRGMPEGDAGLVLALSSLVQAAGALCVPLAGRWIRDHRLMVVVVTVLTGVGLASVAWAPLGLIWAAAVVLGLGQGSGFALSLAFIGLRAGDPHAAMLLSGMSQGIGYFIAATGPFAFGLLRDVTGGWTLPIAAALAVAAGQLLPGVLAARARTVTFGGPVAGKAAG